MGHRQSPIIGQNKLELGFFSPNCSSGMSVTKVPGRWQNSWENNIRLAQLADDAGIVVRQIWSHEGPFDWNGQFYELKGVYGFPRPFDGAPPVMNAAGSKEGRQFATRNADFLFAISVDPEQSRQEVIDIREQARAQGRNTGVFTLAHVVCRPTVKEAQDYLRYYADENADWAAVDNLMRLQGMHAQSFPAESLQMLRGRFSAGHGTLPLIGDPDNIAQELARISAAGFAGCTLSFVDYVQEFPYFRDEVLPRLERMGLRQSQE